MLAEHPVVRLALAAMLCIVLIVGAQALAAVSAPPVGQLSQSKVVGAAGFAYLGGLRVLGAGLLYSRLDPQFHQYTATSSSKIGLTSCRVSGSSKLSTLSLSSRTTSSRTSWQ